MTEVGIGQPVWTSDSKGLVFTEVNENWRSYRARYHRLGRPASEDVTLYEETEELGFSVGVGKSQDRSLILVSTGDNATSEARFVSADDPTQPLTLISPRQANREYHVDSAHGKLWVVTNDDHVNFRLAEADLDRPGDWRTVIAGSDRVYLRGATSYRDHLALTTRVDGLDRLVLRDYDGKETAIPFTEASYSAAFFGNPEFAPDAYRLGYSSMVTPVSVYDYHAGSGTLETLKVQEIPSGYDSSLYATERLMVPARDGKQIPVSVVYRKGYALDGSGKLFLYGYGSYGHAIPPAFNSNRISLIDRGWACAIAHTRGGDDLGYGWFLDGKLDKRTNTFNDFADSAKGLIAAGFTSAGQDRDQRPLGRRRTGRGGCEQRSAIVGRGCRRRSVRRRAQHHARRHAAADSGRMARVGQSDHRQECVRLYPQLFALRQREAAGLSADADHRRADRPPGDLLGAGQVGGEAARDQDRRQSPPAQDQHGRGPRRKIGPLGGTSRGRRDLCIHPDRGEVTRTAFEMTFTAGPEHIDELGHVNNAVWVQWIQQVAVAHWESLADPAHKDCYYWVVVRHEIDYLRAAFPGDVITARTWVGEAPKGARFDRHVEFAGADGKLSVRAKTQWAIIDKALGRPIRVPPEVVAPFLAAE